MIQQRIPLTCQQLITKQDVSPTEIIKEKREQRGTCSLNYRKPHRKVRKILDTTNYFTWIWRM